jgi:sulfur carrier protein ThiS adenylyltransferase
MELTNEHLTRQLDIIPVARLNLPIKVIGAGAIGSFATLQLVKMGFTNIEVWDFDTVSVENMSCQFYRFKDIGKPKVTALAELIKDFTNVDITTHNKRYAADPAHRGVILLAVDDMKARKEIFQEIQESQFLVRFVIDPRMGSEDCALYVMDPHSTKDGASYEKTLYTNEDSVQERCTAKATIYTSNLLSGMVAKAVKNIACGEEYPRITQWSIKNNHLMQWGSSHGV